MHLLRSTKVLEVPFRPPMRAGQAVSLRIGKQAAAYRLPGSASAGIGRRRRPRSGHQGGRSEPDGVSGRSPDGDAPAAFRSQHAHTGQLRRQKSHPFLPADQRVARTWPKPEHAPTRNARRGRSSAHRDVRATRRMLGNVRLRRTPLRCRRHRRPCRHNDGLRGERSDTTKCRVQRHFA
jgi:hypothetical protein